MLVKSGRIKPSHRKIAENQEEIGIKRHIGGECFKNQTFTLKSTENQAKRAFM